MLSVTEMTVTVETDERGIEGDREVDLEIDVEVGHQKEIDLGQDHVTEPEEEVTIKSLIGLTGTGLMIVSIHLDNLGSIYLTMDKTLKQICLVFSLDLS